MKLRGHESEDLFRWPERGWSSPRNKKTPRIFALALGCVVAFMALMLVSNLQRKSHGFSLGLSLWIVEVAAVAAVAYDFSVVRRGRFRMPYPALDPARGAGVRSSYRVSPCVWAAIGSLIPGVVFLVGLAESLDGPSASVLPFVLLSLADAIFLIYGGFYVLAACRRPFVALFPSGVFQKSWTATEHVPWGALSSVAPGEVLLNRAGTMNCIRLFIDPDRAAEVERTELFRRGARSSARAFVIVSAKNIETDPALLYRLIEFYHKHADLRGELGDHRAIDRIARRASAPVAAEE